MYDGNYRQQHARKARGISRVTTSILTDYLTTPELAAELNLAPITLLRWRYANEGPAFTKVGRRVLYRRAAVAEWLAKQERSRMEP